MDEPTFSVVVPTYRRPGLLGEAVASVLAQSRRDLECVVVDDAGAPPAAVHDDPRVRLIRRTSNGGLSAARNTGIAAARGRYVTFLDDDDVLAPDRLDCAAEGLRRAPVAICYRGDHPSGRPGRNRELEGWVHDRIALAPVPHVGQACVAREALVTFDERLRSGEEVDWWLRLTRRAPVATVPRIGYLFRIHDGPRHGSGSLDRALARIAVLRRHADYFRAHPRAAAFQWRRVGLLAERADERAIARRAFGRSLLLHPDAAAIWHLARLSVPGRAAGAPR